MANRPMHHASAHSCAFRMATVTLLLAAIAVSSPPGTADASGAARTTVALKTVVEAPSMLHVPFLGLHSDQFLQGLPPAVGSGLEYIGTNADGSIFLYALTDHGPSFPGPTVQRDTGFTASAIFPTPSFAPSYGAVRIADGHAKLLSLIPIKYESAQRSTGLPRSDGPLPLSDTLQPLPADPRSVSPRDITMHRDARSSLWICEAYGPAILQVGANSGAILRRLEPGAGLPGFFRQCAGDGGFSGIAALPSGGLAAVTPGGCGPAGKSTALLAHLSVPWPEAGKNIRVYGIRLPKDGCITDLCPVSDTRVLALQSVQRPDAPPRNTVLLVDFPPAATAENSDAIEYATAKPLIELEDFGWKSPGAGLALFTDRRTIAVISDNEFGLAGVVAQPAITANNVPVTDPAAYTLDQVSRVAYQGRPVLSSFLLRATGERTHLWLFTLDKPVDAY